MYKIFRKALFGYKGTFGVGKGKYCGTELDQFESGVLGDIARARDSNEGSRLF